MSEQVDIIIITQDKWFSYNRIWNEAQLTYIQIPTGGVCWVDGTTAEAYPTYDKEDLLFLVQNNSQEKYKFQCVRAGVVAALSVHARRENVDQGTEIGRRIYRTMAFVTKTEFKRVTGVRQKALDLDLKAQLREVIAAGRCQVPHLMAGYSLQSQIGYSHSYSQL